MNRKYKFEVREEDLVYLTEELAKIMKVSSLWAQQLAHFIVIINQFFTVHDFEKNKSEQ